MATVNFHDAATSALQRHVVGGDGGRRQVQIDLRLTETTHGPADPTRREATAPMAFRLASPADVTGLAPGAITRRYPAPGTHDAEPSRLVLVEFADEALPWVYSPADGSGPSKRPWLVLLAGPVGEDQAEITVSEGGDHPHAVISDTLLRRLPPLTSSDLWAHVQELDGERVARLLAPVVLEPDRDYVAVLVPAFVTGGDGLIDAWDPAATEPVQLPAYDHWRFRTGAADDFLALALALEPQVAPPDLGRVPLRYPRRPLQRRLWAEGALTAVAPVDEITPDPTDPWGPVEALPVDVSQDLDRLQRLDDETDRRDERGRPILSLPLRGEPWPAADPPPEQWARALNGDPRLRGTGGLGAEVGITEQEKLVDLTTRHLGAHQEASQRLRSLALGIEAARSLWNRRLPATSAGLIHLLAPAMGRIVTEQGPLLDVVAGPDRSFAPSSFSSAARRALRSGPARTALAREPVTPDRIVEASNQCPPDPTDPTGLVTLHPEPFAPERKIPGDRLGALLDPDAVADPSDAPIIRSLRAALDDALFVDGDEADGTVRLPDWSQPAAPRTARLAWRETGTVEGLTTVDMRVTIDVTSQTVSGKDSLRIESRTTQLGTFPGQWDATASVGGQPVARFSSGMPAVSVQLPGPGPRRPQVEIVVTGLPANPVEVELPTEEVSTTASLAGFTGVLQARAGGWADGRVQLDLSAKITNLSDASVTPQVAVVFTSGQPSIAVPPQTLAGGATANVSQRVDVDTGDADAVGLHLTVNDQSTGVLELARPVPRPVTPQDAPWLPILVVAALGAIGSGAEAEALWAGGLRQWAAHVGEHGLGTWAEALNGTPFAGLTAADAAEAMARMAGHPRPLPPAAVCRTVDLDRLANVLRQAFDPTPDTARAIGRVLQTLPGRPEDEGTQPLGICPDLPVPAWELLRAHRGDWLLPGLTTVDSDAVLGLRSNWTFVESFLVGLNEQLLAELTWRGLPVATGCTPVRRFWGRTDVSSGEPLADIEPISGWGDTPIAETSHRVQGAGEVLVVLLRTELFRRYPATVVYLLPAGAPGAAASSLFEDPEGDHERQRVFPDFQGRIGADVTFFGFTQVTPKDGARHWFVLEEPSRGFRFWGVKAVAGGGTEDVLRSALEDATGGADLAAHTFADPIRVLIRGDRLLPDGAA